MGTKPNYHRAAAELSITSLINAEYESLQALTTEITQLTEEHKDTYFTILAIKNDEIETANLPNLEEHLTQIQTQIEEDQTFLRQALDAITTSGQRINAISSHASFLFLDQTASQKLSYCNQTASAQKTLIPQLAQGATEILCNIKEIQEELSQPNPTGLHQTHSAFFGHNGGDPTDTAITTGAKNTI